jgi:hypothetical protein
VIVIWETIVGRLIGLILYSVLTFWIIQPYFIQRNEYMLRGLGIFVPGIFLTMFIFLLYVNFKSIPVIRINRRDQLLITWIRLENILEVPKNSRWIRRWMNSKAILIYIPLSSIVGVKVMGFKSKLGVAKKCIALEIDTRVMQGPLTSENNKLVKLDLLTEQSIVAAFKKDYYERLSSILCKYLYS